MFFYKGEGILKDKFNLINPSCVLHLLKLFPSIYCLWQNWIRAEIIDMLNWRDTLHEINVTGENQYVWWVINANKLCTGCKHVLRQ